MVLVGAHAHPLNQAKQPCALSWSSSHLVHSRRPCHLWSSFLSLIFSSSAFLRCCLNCYLLILLLGACCEVHDGSRVAKFRLVPSSSATLCASFSSEENLFSHTFSSNIRTLLITGFGFSYCFLVALILINLYSRSTDLSPRPPVALGIYSTAVELRGCVPPFSLINFPVSLSVLCSSPSGQCWVHIGYVKTEKVTWFVALTQLMS